MAAATIEICKVKKMVEAEVDEEFVVLRLNKEEFAALNLLLNGVGGCPLTSARKHTDAIMNAMKEVRAHSWCGVGPNGSQDFYELIDKGISFKPKSFEWVKWAGELK